MTEAEKTSRNVRRIVRETCAVCREPSCKGCRVAIHSKVYFTDAEWKERDKGTEKYCKKCGGLMPFNVGYSWCFKCRGQD